jgi:hypothetical protein
MFRYLFALLAFCPSVYAQNFEIVVVPSEFSLEKDISHLYLGMPNPIYLDFDADLDSFRLETLSGKIITSVNIIREYFVIPDKIAPLTIKATAFFSNRKVITKTRSFTVIPPPNLGLQLKANKTFTSGIITFNLIDNISKANVEKNFMIGAYEVDIFRAGNLILRGVFSGNLLVNISKMEDSTKVKPGDVLKIKQIRLLDLEKNIPAYTKPFEIKL